MKNIILITVWVLFPGILLSQQFEKVLDEPPVNDNGDSRAVNWIDYDKDGDLDLFVTNGPNPGENNFFYKNNGDGSFTKISDIIISQDNKSSDGSTWGDFDNDGFPDLFVANWWNQENLLYKNNGDGTFTFLSSSPVSSKTSYSESGNWGDYNNDGFIDLYVCNSYGSRRNFLYKNDAGIFSQINSGDAVLNSNYSRNVDWIDLTGDGLLDIFITNEENQNESLYKNNGTDIFNDYSIPSLLENGGNSSSSSWGDIDNDGDFDLFVANWGGQTNFLFLNNGDGSFTIVENNSVVTDESNSFGSAFADIDNDGDLDLYVTNAFSGSTELVNYFYLNNGDGTFIKDESTFPPDSGWSYGCAFGDYDKNGYLDLFVAKCFNANENNLLYKNIGGDYNYLLIDLEGVKSNRSAIGAIVKAKANLNGKDVWQMRRVAGQSGYCGQNLQLHFGLADASQIDSLIIEWPSGIIQKMENVPVNQFLNIQEDTTLTSIDDDIAENPSEFKLGQNYPNPFNPTTTIKYEAPPNLPNGGAFVTVKVYDVLGNEVKTLVNEYKKSGVYEIIFNAKELSGGVYFYSLITESASSSSRQTMIETKKMILIK